jgi:hypothetical protein
VVDDHADSVLGTFKTQHEAIACACRCCWPKISSRRGSAEKKVLKLALSNYLQRWPVSKRVNSSKADADVATLIDPIQVAAV